MQSNFEEMEFNTNAEANAREKMPEEKIIRPLEYNVKLGKLQKTFDRLAAKVLERKTYLGNKEEQKARKR